MAKILDGKNIGLYRDDGLAIVANATGQKLNNLRKRIVALFKAEGLSITIETDLIETDFLDVTFNLSNNKYYPYRKPNNKPLYINAKSNHPPSIIQQLPSMIEKRLLTLSCDENEFNKAKEQYESALRQGGYNAELKFNAEIHPRRRNRTRKVIWFNPPFTQNLKTNIGKIFLRLVKRHFPRRHRYRKIFNANTLKLSYSCMPNMGSIIKQHNAKISSAESTGINRKCNCRRNATCPLNGECLAGSIVYEATVKSGNDTHTYFGLSEPPFKDRYKNHTKSFRLRKYENETELSKHIWALKDKGTPFILSWKIAARASPYRCGTRRCDLCLTEKALIVRAEPKGLLNKRTELISKCRHRNKFLLCNVK